MLKSLNKFSIQYFIVGFKPKKTFADIISQNEIKPKNDLLARSKGFYVYPLLRPMNCTPNFLPK